MESNQVQMKTKIHSYNFHEDAEIKFGLESGAHCSKRHATYIACWIANACT